MKFGSIFGRVTLLPKLRQAFREKEMFFHDGAIMRRVHVTTPLQVGAAATAVAAFCLSAFGVLQVAVGAQTISNAVGSAFEARGNVAQMEARVASLQADMVAIKDEAKRHAARLEARQAFLAAVLKGEADPAKLAAMLPSDVNKTPAAAAEVAAMFHRVDSDQKLMANDVRKVAELRYQTAVRALAKLGISSERMGGQSMTGVGGPFEPVQASANGVANNAANSSVSNKADPNFRALFNSWKRLDQLQTGIVAIPSARPVSSMALTSNFGIRVDPFRGGAAMHAGVDIPGPYATPIYATADGFVGRTGRIGGYGNLVELEHGRGIQTRYGHLSSILVGPGKRIKRGELIGLMGSTGRSTGNHLHYEVRIDGRAVNPMPFLQSTDYLVAMQRRSGGATALGGPVEGGGSK
jgi:murein DD-endopeptidase MepM/ murein hydrolase activator NlpD